MSEPHPDIVQHFGYADERGKVKGKHKRKKIIDLRACRFCHLKQWKRERHATLMQQEAERRRIAYEKAVANGEELNDPRLIPPEARPQRVLVCYGAGGKKRWGYDPVLLYCKHVLKDSKSRRNEVLRKTEVLLSLRDKEGVARAPSVGKSDAAPDPALTFLKYQWKLYTARIELVLLIRERRRRDLQSLATAGDPVRLDWSAYVTPEEKAKVVRAARRANTHRVAIVLDPDKVRTARVGARPFTWMPDLSFGMKDEKAERKIVALAWADHIARARNSQAKATKFIRHSQHRDPEQERLHRFLPKEGEAQAFTMLQFHRKLIEAAQLAIDRIEQAIGMGMHPTNYTGNAADDEGSVITRWEQLVPLHVEEIRSMRSGLPDVVNDRIDPFSRLFVPRVVRSLHSDDPQVKEEERAKRRTRKQMEKGLDYNGLALPIPAPAMEHG
jgi:hypothetical protein